MRYLDKRLLVVLIPLLGLLSACTDSDDADGNTNSPPDDPYTGLRDNLAPGEIHCSADGDSCCLNRCWENPTQSILCVSRNPSVLADAFDYGCDAVILPEWFYANDCFVLTEDDSFTDHVELMFIQCFCGRTTDTFASEYSAISQFMDNGCGQPLSDEVGTPDPALFTCDNPCNTCTPDCADRSCGPDGCGGTCAPGCSGDDTCNAAGQCVTSAADSCSSCLSTCQGIPGCCTGCGCLCEDACGMCW